MIRPSSAAAVAPTDGTTYTANTAYAAGNTTGTNNYVVLAAPAATTSVTVTGLTSGTTYAVDVYSYNVDASAPTTNYLTSTPATFTFTARPTYRWNVATGNISGTATNWTPSRTATSGDDVLVVDGSIAASVGSTITVNGNFTARQIYFINNASATLFANGGRTITLDGNEGDDFEVEAGSTARFGATSKNNDVTLTLNGSATAEINGTLVFENTSGAPGQKESNHRLTGSSNSVIFRNGSTFQMAPGALGNPFGTNNSIAAFQSGSTFRQESGLDPFGPNGSGAASFSAGSTYIFAGGTFSNAARTYGNLDFRANYATTGSFATTILNNLTLTGAIVVSLNNTGGVTIGGNVDTGSGAQLNVNPSSAADVTFNGTGAVQTIGGAGVVALGATTTLVLANPLGLRLLKPLDIPNALRFAAGSGHFFTSTTNYLTMPTTASVTGANRTSYIEGILVRASAGAGVYPASTSTGLFFPIGTPNGYGPVTLALTQTSASGTYQFDPIADRAPLYTLPTGPNALQRVSGVRYYNASTNAAFNTAQISFGFINIDQVDAPSTLRIAQSAFGRWTDVGGAVSGAQADGAAFLAGTVTSTTALTITSSTDFALATTNLSNAPGNNPLPVALTSFTAERRGADALLKWTTAQEKNSAYFEVQRSLDGLEFRSVGRVQAQGNSTRASSYSFLDKAATGTVYYRLHQVDLDGTATDSRIVALGGTSELLVAAYPNPVQHELHLQLGEGPVQWRVLSLLGQPLRQGKALGSATIDLAALPAGSYQLEVRSGTQRVIRPLIKSN
ncbi:T9SS type A sorting domain-containing protein [Hymenobacter jeollabukensis]|uniref:T9SS type A sorting domain-containing protein n=1 Tax=Hymenobacter jeollabukensis TaxID=2025313 RepID=UPI001484D059|nr:T9SS type A sorting domain-containing protein [Hymenobacter jeollabukensis]